MNNWIQYELDCGARAVAEGRLEDAIACQDRAIIHYNSVNAPLYAWMLYDMEWSDYGDEREILAIVDAIDSQHARLLLHRLGFVVDAASRYLIVHV